MKIVKYVALALLALVGVLLLVGLCMPQEWTVERSLVVRAEPARIHPLVGNLEGWKRWMPWLEDDPKMTLAFAGTAGAPGSTMRWTSEAMGNGTLTVTKSDPATGLEYELSMDEFAVPAHGSIRYSAEGDATRLTWRDTGTLGRNPFVRLFGPLLEGALGQSFEKGLANVKSVVEGGG